MLDSGFVFCLMRSKLDGSSTGTYILMTWTTKSSIWGKPLGCRALLGSVKKQSEFENVSIFIPSRPIIIFSRGASFEAFPMASVLYMLRFDTIQSARVDKMLQTLVVMCCVVMLN